MYFDSHTKIGDCFPLHPHPVALRNGDVVCVGGSSFTDDNLNFLIAMGFNVRLTGYRLNLAGNVYPGGFRRVPFRSSYSFHVKIEIGIKQISNCMNGVRSQVRSLCC
jgi:hypothetical protein